MMSYLLSYPSSCLSGDLSSIGPALANHLWQSTVFAAAVWLLTFLLRRNQARIRYSLWLAASLKFLLPFSFLMSLGTLLPRPQQVVPAPAIYSAVDMAAQPFAETDVAILIPPPARVPSVKERLAASVPMVLAVAWLCGMAVVLVVWSARWRQVWTMLRCAPTVDQGREVELLRRVEQATGMRRSVPLRVSQNRLEPGIFGILRPVLLWPQRLSDRLDDEHIEAILAHELMHVRRRDNLTAVLHMVVEALFWFHPAVWWMERRMVDERERACDEAVVHMGGKPEAYAESLLKACRFCMESPLTCVSGITGANLKQRVVQIMTGRVIRKLTLPKKLLLLAVALCAITVPIMLGQANAARRMILAAVQSAPKPFRLAAHAMIAEISTPAVGEISEAPLQQAPGTRADGMDMSNDAPLRFEVASIRPAAPQESTSQGPRRASVFMDDGISARDVPMNRLLATAYDVNQLLGQIIGAPDWVGTQAWDIEAKIADGDVAAYSRLMQDRTPEGMHRRDLMLQAFLAERFKLKAHYETREQTIYSLEVTKGGFKAKPVAANAASSVRFTRGNGHYQAHSADIKGLATYLAMSLRQPVLDKTGLTGNYDITLDWQPDTGASADPGAAGSSKPSLPAALEEQLGLKLVAGKGPVDVVVVDHIEKPSVDGAELRAQAGMVPVALVQEKAAQTTSGAQATRQSFGVVTGGIPVKDAAGKTVRFSAWIKTDNVVNGYAGLWWRVDGPGERNNRPTLAFDNSQARFIDDRPDTGNGTIRGATGTTPWTHYEIVLPIDKTASNINFGVLLSGTGTAWVDAMEVDLDGVRYSNPQLDLDFESPTVKGFYTGCGGYAGCTDYKVGIDGTASFSGHQSLKMQFVGDSTSVQTPPAQTTSCTWPELKPNPLNLDFSQGNVGSAPPGWKFGQAAPARTYEALIAPANQCHNSPQCASVHSRDPAAVLSFLYQELDASPYRGQTLTYRAFVRIDPAFKGVARLLVRVHRQDCSTTFRDDMGNHPVVSGEWAAYEIRAPIASDAYQIEFGVQLVGAGALWIDQNSMEFAPTP